MDLLTSEEEAIDQRTAHLRFDIRLLAGQLVSATDCLPQNVDTRHLSIGYFGASTGAAAALVAAASVLRWYTRSSRAADVLTWPARHCLASARPHCSSSVATMSKSLSSIGQHSRYCDVKSDS